MITSMHIENFKCFKDFDITLGPFNVLIGPNDSGKTALLEAIRLVGHAGTCPPGAVHVPGVLGEAVGFPMGPEIVWKGTPEDVVIAAFGSEEFGIGVRSRPTGGFMSGHAFIDTRLGTVVTPDPNSFPPWVERSFSRVAYYRFDPSALKRPCPLGDTMGRDGAGFAAYLDNMLRTSRPSFEAVECALQERFSPYVGLSLPATRLGRKDFGLSVAFRTTFTAALPASSVSDGVMLSLAFLALALAPNSPKLLLQEEPENGVHHASLKGIIATLKQLSADKGVQVILTTHSPYLLDEVEPKDVHVFQKDKEGAVHARRLSEFPDVEDLRKHFMTGEIWTGLEEEGVLAANADAEAHP